APKFQLPRIEQIVAELADDADTVVEPVSLDRARARRRSWTAKFPVRLIPGAMPLKVKGFASHWGAELAQSDENNFVIRLDARKSAAAVRRASAPCGVEPRLP